jgi:carbon storage regulator
MSALVERRFDVLVLSRKVGESIDIGGGIEVAVLSVRNGRVRLGFAAPQSVTIRRREIEPACQPDAAKEATEPASREVPAQIISEPLERAP